MSLMPWFITGLTEGEGCFSISFTLKERLKLGIETRPSFSISLNQRDLDLLKEVHVFFKCGSIRYSRADRTYKYEVRSISDLMESVILHFKHYSLQGSKLKDFKIFEAVCISIKSNLHRNRNHLIAIINSAYQMNPSGKRKHDKHDLLRILDE